MHYYVLGCIAILVGSRTYLQSTSFENCHLDVFVLEVTTGGGRGLVMEGERRGLGSGGEGRVTVASDMMSSLSLTH